MIFCKYRPLYVFDLGKIDKNKTSRFIIDPNKNKHLLDILVNHRLHAVKFYEFNDINEGVFYCKNLSDYDKERIYTTKSEYNNNGKKVDKRICCFGNLEKIQEYGKEDLMWAHYANGFCGIRIDFKTEEEPIKIDYKDDFSNLVDLDNIDNALKQKLSAWEYEQEYRVIGPKEYIDISIENILIGKGYYKSDKLDDDINSLIPLANMLKIFSPKEISIEAFCSRYDDTIYKFSFLEQTFKMKEKK